MRKNDRKLDKNINAKWFNDMSHYGFGRFLNNGEKKMKNFQTRKSNKQFMVKKQKLFI